MTNIELEISGNRFYAPCVVTGQTSRQLRALIDTGSSVTGVRGDICRDLGLAHAGTRDTTCVHGSHAGVEMDRHLCKLDLGGVSRYVIVHELGWIDEEGGGAVEMMLGRDMLEMHCILLDWLRRVGRLES